MILCCKHPLWQQSATSKLQSSRVSEMILTSTVSTIQATVHLSCTWILCNLIRNDESKTSENYVCLHVYYQSWEFNNTSATTSIVKIKVPLLFPSLLANLFLCHYYGTADKIYGNLKNYVTSNQVRQSEDPYSRAAKCVHKRSSASTERARAYFTRYDSGRRILSAELCPPRRNALLSIGISCRSQYAGMVHRKLDVKISFLCCWRLRPKVCVHPLLQYLHLHVISEDFHSPALKTKVVSAQCSFCSRLMQTFWIQNWGWQKLWTKKTI